MVTNYDDWRSVFMPIIKWMTDVHLDHLKPDELDLFLNKVSQVEADGIALTGDISNGKQLVYHLAMLDAAAPCVIYLVLGNHDYYSSSIIESRATASRIANASKNLRAFDDAHRSYRLTDKVGVVGHGGWADARLGNFQRSTVDIGDYYWIEELAKHNGNRLLLEPHLNYLGDESAKFITQSLLEANNSYEEFLVLTHVPPFRDNAVYAGKISDDNWLPHFSNKAFGDALLSFGKANPNKKITCLAGHSHGRAIFSPLPNLTCYTGPAEYGHPAIQKFEFKVS